MVAQREFECSYQKTKWILGMRQEEIPITIYMYSAIIMYQALYYAFFRYYIVFITSYKTLTDSIPWASSDQVIYPKFLLWRQ